MKNTASFAAPCGAAFAMSGTAFAAPSVLGVTTGAGYIPMVKAVNEVCKAPDVKIEGHFGGNIGQELAQIEAGNDVSVVVSDASTLKKIKSKVTYTKTVTLGDTPMMMVWKKGLNLKEIVVFNALDQKAIREIARIQIRKLAKRMEQQNIGLDVTEAALDEIGKVGVDPLFCARPLRRAVQDYLENQIAVDILKGKYAPGDTVFVDYVDGNFIFEDRKDNR